MVANLIGILLYFGPAAIPSGKLIGVVMVVVGMLANSFGTVIGRDINR